MSTPENESAAPRGLFTSWIAEIPDAYKVMGAIVSVFTAGVIAAVTFISYLNIPNAVENNAAALQGQRERIERLESDHEKWAPLIEDVPDMVESMNSLERQMRQANCFEEADKREVSWAPCLRPPYTIPNVP